MSGFLVTQSQDAEKSFISQRGLDRLQTGEIEGYQFSHYLVDGTGGRATQPFVEGEVVCVFDGEIYNHPVAGTDSHALISLYHRHGEEFPRHLDGDFAMALYDFDRRVMVLATDAFGTKPLFVHGTEAASYRSGLGDGQRVAPNTILVIDLDTGKSCSQCTKAFDFAHQHKNTYDDWIEEFERAVSKRAVPGSYLPLSAGYDSGGIDCALRALGTEYKAFSIEGVENLDLLNRRRRPGGEILRMTPELFVQQQAFLRTHTEEAKYRATNFLGEKVRSPLLKDRATCGLALIHSLARAEGHRVFLSGQGADEILAANRHWPQTLFPEHLKPWIDFCGGWQAAYLTKEEFIAGTFGMEGRYPFLDRDLVQEFLWLSPEFKNRRYKAPLHEYMTRQGYPFDEDIKTGFNPLRVVN
jgi:asparagine synthetase B (glutamine-hydrolysing)